MRLKTIRFFAPDGNSGAEPQANEPAGGTSGQNQQESGQNATPPSFDYEKLAGIIQGKQNVAEDTVLKNYFKQQGLSQADAEAAIAAFKQQKADSQPNVEAMQAQLNAAQAESRRLLLENAATVSAIEMGMDARTIPYLLKMADLTNCLSQDGKVDDEAMKKALNQVLEDVPALKPTEGSKHGFVQIGTGGGSEKPEGGNPPTPMPTKRWNRFH